MRKVRIRKDDKVLITVGKDKGKVSKVLKVLKKDNKLLVESVNKVKRHLKPNPYLNRAGGIIEKELPIDISNVMLFCSRCNRGVRTTYLVVDEKKSRCCRRCKLEI